MIKFKVGEIAIYYSPEPNPEPNGLELTILSEPEASSRGPEYKVSGFEHGHTYAFEFCLRKKKPPEEEINWVEKLNLTNWNPAREIA